MKGEPMEISVESVFTQPRALCDDLVARVAIREKVVRLAAYAAASAALYGTTMGLYHSPWQAVVSAVKVPVLFLLTLAIALPSLHFLGLLFGSPVRFGQSVVVLLTGLCQSSILLAAFAPISVFFLVSGSPYPFLLVMHVTIFAFCGAAGLCSVYRNFGHVRDAVGEGTRAPSADHLLKVWMLLYMLVGTQMAFNLSPFLNHRGSPVTFFNTGKGNFYSYLLGVVLEWLRS